MQSQHADDFRPLERLLRGTKPSVARSLGRALEGDDLSVDEIAQLFTLQGEAFILLTLVADELRRQQVGEIVTYVVNRNINFTNVCIKRCGFCAFSRDYRGDDGYFLPIPEVVRRAKEAVRYGATEICVQAGLAPKLPGDHYIRLTEALKAELPDLHIHGFSPEEVLYGSTRSRMSIREYLAALREAGVGSLPGTSAEILVQSVRDRISRGRITAAQWEQVVRTAHEQGIPTTATIMYGHVETFAERALHLGLVRTIQRDTGGFTEFVPLSFVHSEAPMWARDNLPETKPGPTGQDVVRMHAISRIVLGRHIPNLQASWVKEGPRFAQLLLAAGVNDLGGTLLNESISTSAGAGFGQLVRPAELRALIRDAGRIPAERTTLYRLKKIFDGADDVEEKDPLDAISDEEIRGFGSYQELLKSDAFRFVPISSPRVAHGD